MEPFDFKGAEGLQLNLLDRGYAFLIFPGSEAVNERYEALRADMRPLLSILRTPPKSRDGGHEAKRTQCPAFSGELYMSDDGGFKFLQHSYTLDYDILSIRRPHVRILF